MVRGVRFPCFAEGKAGSKRQLAAPDVATESPRQKGPSSLHSRLIAGYVEQNPGTLTVGFESAFKKWNFKHRRAISVNRDGHWNHDPLGFRPDAYRFDEDSQTLYLVETENTSRISLAKWGAISDFFWLVDAAEWRLFIDVIDRTGSVVCINGMAAALMEETRPGDLVTLYVPGTNDTVARPPVVLSERRP